MLVLLVIFMVTANYIVHKSIRVRLPKAETAETQTTSKNLAFALDSGNRLYLDGKEISFEEIGAYITKTKASLQETQQTSLQALITADEATPHGQVIKLIDTVRKNGITEFAINVNPDTSDQTPDPSANQAESPKPETE
ncbi:MAG: biopolymer transporter ExbD [Deltaproteobacteria bacterium]|nr:biopolymer transporter ExbD [Deltaproteobacteria bacterium]